MVKGNTGVHRLSDVDLEKRTAVCANCGPVRIKVQRDAKKIRRRCLAAHNATRRAGERSVRLRRRYRLTSAEYDQRLLEQDGTCAICQKPPDAILKVDHCHATGQVRGLLCHRCNVGLGWFEDDPSRLVAAALYLLHDESAAPTRR